MSPTPGRGGGAGAVPLAVLFGLLACAPTAPPAPSDGDAGATADGSTTPDAARPPCQDEHGGDGYDDLPGSGAVFVHELIELPPAGVGVDLDGDGAVDDHLNASLGSVRDEINRVYRERIATGRILFTTEVAGLCGDYRGDDPAVSFKSYDCIDGDDDIANNFCGAPGCGLMQPTADQLQDGQAVGRAPPTPLVAELAHTRVDGDAVVFPRNPQTPLLLSVIASAVTLPADRASLDVISGAALPARLQHQVPFDWCELVPASCLGGQTPPEMSVLELLLARGIQPDLDLDGDGLERFELDDSYHLSRCIDGDSRAVDGASCLDDPSMVDGYSVTFHLHGVPGALVLP